MSAHALHDFVSKLATYSILVCYKDLYFLFIVSMFTDVPDLLFAIMGFIKYKNQFGDLVNDANYCIIGAVKKIYRSLKRYKQKILVS